MPCSSAAILQCLCVRGHWWFGLSGKKQFRHNLSSATLSSLSLMHISINFTHFDIGCCLPLLKHFRLTLLVCLCYGARVCISTAQFVQLLFVSVDFFSQVIAWCGFVLPRFQRQTKLAQIPLWYHVSFTAHFCCCSVF